MSVRSINEETTTFLIRAEQVLDSIKESLHGMGTDSPGLLAGPGLLSDMETNTDRARRILSLAEQISLALFEVPDAVNVEAQKMAYVGR